MWWAGAYAGAGMMCDGQVRVLWWAGACCGGWVGVHVHVRVV